MGTRCESSANCPYLYYCDLVTKYCENCAHICQPSVGLPGLCKQDCPDYPGTTKLPTRSTVDLRTVIPTTVTTLKAEEKHKSNIFILLTILAAVLVVFLIIAIIVLCYRLKYKDQWKDLQCCKNENNAEEAHEMVDQRTFDEDRVQEPEGESTHSTYIDQPSQPPADQRRYSPAVGHPSSYSEGQYEPSPSRVEQASLLEYNGTAESKPNLNGHKDDKEDLMNQSLNNKSSATISSDGVNQNKKNYNTKQLADNDNKKQTRNLEQEQPLSHTSSETQTEPVPHLKNTVSIQTQTDEPYFELDRFSSVPKQLRDEAVQILRPGHIAGSPVNQRLESISKRNEAAVEEASKSIVLKKQYENDTEAVDTLHEAIVLRDSPLLEVEEQTSLKAVDHLTVPQQETSPLIPEGASNNAPKPGVHPNRRIYDKLKSIHWVQGYYSEGKSIEVYVNFEDISQEHALSELVRITGEKPEKFKVLPNEPVAYQSMRFAAII